MIENLPAPELFDIGNATAETRNLKPLDQRLRAKGCRIEHRRNGQEAVWSHRKHGKRAQSVMVRLLGLDKETA